MSADQEYWFRYSISVFKHQMIELGYDLAIFKEEDPIYHINRLVKEKGYDKVIIDKPLFNFPFAINVDDINCEVEFIDSDIYAIDCKEQTVEDRVNYWISNFIEYGNQVSTVASANGIKLKGEKFILIGREEIVDLGLSDPTAARFISVMPRYDETHDTAEGTFRVSGHLQHGMIDPGILVFQILSSSLYDRLAEETWHIKPLQQLAKREIAIIKAREYNLQPYDDTLDWAEIILDPESFFNIIDQRHHMKFTKQELFDANTEDEEVNIIVRKAKSEAWMHHLLRKCFASKVYYGIGGGPEALDTLVEFFNKFTIDSQSPSTMVNCIESFRLVDGKIPECNSNEVFNILGM